MSKLPSAIEDFADLIGSSSSGMGYEFAEASVPDKMLNARRDNLMAGLGLVASRVQGATAASDYLTERHNYIALNKALNIDGVIAPRFRSSLSAGGPSSKERTMVQNIISNDHQVLDLHWLDAALGGPRDRALPSRWQGLFGFGRGLDVNIASRFAGTAGSAADKCVFLGLPEDEQLQLRTIQTAAVRSRWTRPREKREQVRVVLACAATTDESVRKNPQEFLDVWLAAEIGEYTGYGASAWYSMITGTDIPDSTLSRRRKRLGSLLAGKR